MPPPSEATLAALLAEREWVRRLARGLTRDADAAHDVAQESWLTVLRHPPRHTSNLRSWLARLVRSKARERARGEARRERREREAVALRGRTPGEALERVELVRALVEGVLALREPYRTALVLVYFEGLAPKDAAARVGVPDATFRSHVKRGLELVRERLDRKHGGRRGDWLAGVAGLAFEYPDALAPLASSTLTAVSAPGAAAALASGTALGTGILLMKWKLVLAAGLLLLLGWFAWSRSQAPHGERAHAGALPGHVPLADTDGPKLPSLAAERVPLIVAEPPAVDRGLGVAATEAVLDVTVVYERDERPAVAVGVQLHIWDEHQRSTRRDLVTDEHGRVRIDGIRPGAAGVIVDRGGSAHVEVAAGETAEVIIAIPRGVRVRGRVVAPAGVPVPGAAVCLAHQGVFEAHATAHADAEGRFELADLDGDAALGARMAGFAPSDMVQFELDAGLERDIELVLKGAGGAVRGRVLGPDGAPVAGARVAIGDERPHSVSSDPGERVTVACAWQVLSAGDGTFLVDGLPLGVQPVRVEAAGFPVHSARVQVLEGRTNELELRLLVAGALRGRVLLESGAPAPLTRVELGPRGALDNARVRTDELGWFRIDRLAAGEHELVAGDVVLGRVEARVDVRSGEESQVEIVLARGLVLEGRVVDAADRPLAGWRVRAEVAQDRFTNAEFDSSRAWPPGWNATLSDDDGRFVLSGLPALLLRLEVHAPDLDGDVQPRALLPEVRPPARDLVLRVASAEAPATWLTGTLVDADGRPVGGAELTGTLSPRGAGAFATTARSDADTGRFRLGPFPHGMYALHGRARGFQDTYLGVALIEATDAQGERDLGLLGMKPAGSLVVVLRRRDSGSTTDASVWILADGARRELRQRAGDRIVARALAPGRYELFVEEGGVLDRDHPIAVEIRRDETTETVIELEPRPR